MERNYFPQGIRTNEHHIDRRFKVRESKLNPWQGDRIEISRRSFDPARIESDNGPSSSLCTRASVESKIRLFNETIDLITSNRSFCNSLEFQQRGIFKRHIMSQLNQFANASSEALDHCANSNLEFRHAKMQRIHKKLDILSNEIIQVRKFIDYYDTLQSHLAKIEANPDQFFSPLVSHPVFSSMISGIREGLKSILKANLTRKQERQGALDTLDYNIKLLKRKLPVPETYFFESSSGDLNEDEKHLRADKLVDRIERDEREKRALTRKLDNLRKDYTTAMHIVYTSMYAASQIYHLVQFGKELYKNNPEVLARFAEKPLVEIAWHVAQNMNERTGGTEYQDKYDRWVDHYKLNLVLTSLSHKLKANPDSHLSHLPRFIMNDAGKLIPIPVPVPPPLLGPIEIYNRRRSHLMSEIAAHNYTNEKYNQKYPHLDDNFKLGTFDDEGKLTPDISHLPSLEGALKKKTWEEYKEKFRLCPVEIPEDIKNIGEAFSQGSVEWQWDGKDEKYELIYYK